MSQNSSISNFKPYIICALGLALGFVALAWVAQHWAGKLGVDAHTYGLLRNHQMQKLEMQTQPVDTVFIGDSSLGNAIDVRVWQKLENEKALNLALMGFFGFGGISHMGLQAIEELKPKNLIIMQNIILATFNPDFDHLGEALIARHVVNTESSIVQQFNAWSNIFLDQKVIRKNIKNIYKFYSGKKIKGLKTIKNDYVEQVSRLDAQETRDTLKGRHKYYGGHIDQSKGVYLRNLAKACQTNGVNCVVVHGPIFDVMCERVKEYMPALNRFYEENGLKIVDKQPICYPDEDIGDTYNHIHPDKKASYTGRYSQILRPYLKKP